MIDTIKPQHKQERENKMNMPVRKDTLGKALEVLKYTDATRIALKEMKEHCDSDQFIKDCRKKAWEKVNAAIKPNGQINWSKLPKLIGQNTKISKDVAAYKLI